jgi:3-methyladenine DNA glycosylase AlkD
MVYRRRCPCLRRALLLVACACARQSARVPDSSLIMSVAADSNWYVPPGGCRGKAAIRLPADSFRIQSGWSDTSRDLNARDAALARVVPGGWAGEWLGSDGLVIGLVDTSRRLEAVQALYARGHRINGDLMKARAQPVLWDLAQLDDWYNVIIPRAYERRAITNSGIRRTHNRISLGVRDSTQRRALTALLASLDVPCYLVSIDRGIIGVPARGVMRPGASGARSRLRDDTARRMPNVTMAEVESELRALANPSQAEHAQRFFKTGKGQYGEGDRFLGIRVPALRALARRCRSLPVEHTLLLLRSEWHEQRLLALLLLVEHYRHGTEGERQAIYRAYLAHTRYINNWDLVDSSAEHLVGPQLNPEKPRGLFGLDALARSDSVWERRIAMLATFHWIKQGEYRPALLVATRLMDDPHDLIHKAVGWMLREVGKRDLAVEEGFLREHHREMPRTMLRYAIERLPETRRQQYLRGEL